MRLLLGMIGFVFNEAASLLLLVCRKIIRWPMQRFIFNKNKIKVVLTCDNG